MKGKMNIYYDEVADYLEVFVGEPRKNYGEETREKGVTLFKDSETGEIIGFGIIGFKKKTKNLTEVKLNLPFDIGLFSKEVKEA
jgi:uncharacterized protein YuzE